MTVIGVDVHKKTHTCAAADANGRRLADKTVAATSAGHTEALRWARSAFGAELLWAVEDCRVYSGGLERDLLAAGQRVVRVPPHLTAQRRARGRARGKSDPIDALAVARAALREPDLPTACHDDASREMKLLVDRREDLIGQRTATINRLLGRVHELDPARDPGVNTLRHIVHRRHLGAWLADQPGLLAELARDELADLNRLSEHADALDKRIRERVRAVAPALLAVPGCGHLTAAKIMGETANVTRFRSEAAFASHSGIAPVPEWSGRTAGRVRVNRWGNRQLNAAVHRIAVTQIRMNGAGRAYYRRRIDEGDSNAAARRALKRRLTRVVYQRLRTDHARRHQSS